MRYVWAGLLAVAIEQCVIGEIVRTSFTRLDGFAPNGMAQIDGEGLVLTSPEPHSIGGVRSLTRESIDTFNAKFVFRITDGGNGGGDGLALVIQNEETFGTNTEGGIGYVGISRSVAIEFDTWHNPSQHDVNDNHVAVHSRGTKPNTNDGLSLRAAALVQNEMQDGQDHTVRLSYDGQQLSIWVDEVEPTSTPDLSLRIDIPGLIGTNRAYVAFTATTGFAWQRQTIRSFTFNRHFASPDSVQIKGLVPAILIEGETGATWEMQYSEDLDSGQWVRLEKLVQTFPSIYYFDVTAAGRPRRFYRVIPLLEN